MRSVPFVKAFVGRLTAHHGGAEHRLVCDLNGEPASVIEIAGHFRLHAFGRSTATVTVLTAGDSACIKGRPFLLRDAQAPVALDLRSVLTQMRELDGRFSLCAVFDQTLVLATDLLGASAIFYAFASPSTLVFATHYGLLMRSLRQRPPLDNLGLVSMLAGSNSVDGRTPFAHVRRLEAGQSLIAECHFDEVSHRVETYLDPVETLLDVPVASTEAIDEFESSLVAAVRREIATGDHGLMLSGGHDSRAVAQALLLSGRPVPTFTFGEWRSTDVRRARRFAYDVGLAHTLIGYGNWEFHTYAPMITALSHGTCGLQTTHNLVGYDRAAAHTRRGMVGYLGDALTGAHLPRAGQSIADRVFPFRHRWHPEFEAAYRDELAELETVVNARWRAHPELSDTQRALLTDLTIRQATWISTTFDLCDWMLPLSFPFYSRPLIRLCFNLPLEQLQQQRLYRAWIDSSFTRIRAQRRSVPSLGWIAYETLQLLLDRVPSRIGRAQAVGVVDWDRRIERSRAFLTSLSERVEDERLGRVFRKQVQSERPDVPALLGAGLALAGA